MTPDPDDKGSKNEKKNKNSQKQDYRKYDPKEISRRYKINEDFFHRKVKPQILKIARATQYEMLRRIGDNPDIYLTPTGQIRLVSRQNKTLSVEIPKTIWEIIDMLQ